MHACTMNAVQQWAPYSHTGRGVRGRETDRSPQQRAGAARVGGDSRGRLEPGLQSEAMRTGTNMGAQRSAGGPNGWWAGATAPPRPHKPASPERTLTTSKGLTSTAETTDAPAAASTLCPSWGCSGWATLPLLLACAAIKTVACESRTAWSASPSANGCTVVGRDCKAGQSALPSIVASCFALQCGQVAASCCWRGAAWMCSLRDFTSSVRPCCVAGTD